MSLFYRKRLNMSNCCKDCTKRKVGCHGTCKDYKDWLKEHYRIKEQARRNEKKFYDYFYK